MNSSNQNNSSENNSNQPSSRKGKGRQKIDMVKIENETNLQVTFSKRRAGVFKKASELSTLCGAESAIVVFSPGDKAHSFGNPSVETITDRFLNNNNNNNNVPTTNEAYPLRRAHGDAATRQRNQELSRLEAQLKQEKERRKYNEILRKAPQSQTWSPPNLDDLNYQQLDELKRSILSFKQNLETKMQDATSLVNSYGQGSNRTGAPGLPRTSSVGPSHHDHLMFRNKPSLTLGGSSSNAGANDTTFSGYAPYNYYQNIGNSDGVTLQYPDFMGSRSYSYGNPGTEVIPYGYGEGSGASSEKRGSGETQGSSDQDMYPGFTNNDYGRGK